MDFSSAIIAGVLGGAFLLVFFLCVAGMKHEGRKRELAHLERMRALELGHPLPGDPMTEALKALHKPREEEPEAQTPAALAHKYLGGALGLPAGAAFIGSLFHIQGPEAIAMWAAVGAIASACIVCGTVLALVGPRPARVGRPGPSPAPGKPRFDADFEVPPEPSPALARR
jgi:hypothetical protein